MIEPAAETLFLEAFAVIYDTLRNDLQRRGRKPTQRAIARILDVEGGTVSQWIRGRHRGISLEIIARVARACELPIARLFMGAQVLSSVESGPVTLPSSRSAGAPRSGSYADSPPDRAAGRLDPQELRVSLEAIARVTGRLLRELPIPHARSVANARAAQSGPRRRRRARGEQIAS